jgi:hypothetical protein
MGDNEKTTIALWLAAGVVVTGLALPLAHRGMTVVCTMGASMGVFMLAVGLWRLIQRWVR